MRYAPTTRTGAGVRLLVLVEVTSGFLQYGLVPLLPRIGDRLDVSDAALSWVMAVHLLAGAACVPVLGRLGDRHGHRRLLRVSVVLVAAGTLLVALAPTFGLLLLGRVLQGPIAALLPLEIALVRGALPVASARRAVSLLVRGLTFGGLAGAVTTAAVEAVTGELWLALLVPAAMTLGCVVLCLLGVPEAVPLPGVRMDWPGAALLAAATVGLLVGLSTVDSNAAVALVGAAAGVALLAVIGAVELRTGDPLVDLRGLTDRRVLPYYGASALFGVVYFGTQAPQSAFLAADPGTDGYGFALSPIAISLVLLPAIGCSNVASLSSARLARRVGYRACVVAAFAVLAAGFAAMVAARGSLPALCLTVAVIGSGVGLALGTLPTVIVESAPPERSGIATALYNNTKMVGGAVAGGAFAALTAWRTPAGTDVPDESSFLAIWVVAAVGAACAALAAARVPAVRTGSAARLSPAATR
ncbi:MFS transporter [Virgisporangium ochraceum]